MLNDPRSPARWCLRRAALAVTVPTLLVCALAGCGLPSRSPFFPSSVKISDDFIVGEWYLAAKHAHLLEPERGFHETRLDVSKGAEGDYLVQYYPDINEHGEASRVDRFRATMTEIAGYYFIDFEIPPASPSDRDDALSKTHAGMHVLARVSERRLDDCELGLTFPEEARLVELAKQQGVAIESVSLPSGQQEKMLTASTQQLYEFLLRNHDSPELFRDPVKFDSFYKHTAGICRPFTLERGWSFASAIGLGGVIETSQQERHSLTLGLELGFVHAHRNGSFGGYVDGMWALEHSRATISLGPRYMNGVIGADLGYMMGFGGQEDVAHGAGLRVRLDFKYVAVQARYGVMVGAPDTVDFGAQLRWPQWLPW
jgi:hypothetical protein